MTIACRILLYRHQSGELRCEIPLIVSNHPDNQRIADFYRVPYFVVPVTKENKREAEQKQIALIREHKCSLVVLARYMQVLSNEFIATLGTENLINIHHSFLPAFVGSKPYHQAFQRGVKLIGATAHYVTQVLDDGPIIEQDVVRIYHRDTVDDLVQKGRDIEKIVLSRAVRWHVENRILLIREQNRGLPIGRPGTDLGADTATPVSTGGYWCSHFRNQVTNCASTPFGFTKRWPHWQHYCAISEELNLLEDPKWELALLATVQASTSGC